MYQVGHYLRPFLGSRVISCEQTDLQTKLTAAVRNCANTPKNCAYCHIVYLCAVYDTHNAKHYFFNNLKLLVFVMETE